MKALELIFSWGRYADPRILPSRDPFTYRVTRCKDKEKPDLYFVSLLTQDTADDSQFKYLGIITRNGFRLTKNSGVNANAPSAKAFESLFRSPELDPELEDQLDLPMIVVNKSKPPCDRK